MPVDQRALLADLQRQVRALEDDIREHASSLDDVDRRLREEHARGASHRPHRDDLWRVARHPGDPGRGGLGARHGVRALLRGQPPGRAGVDLGARRAAARGRGAAAALPGGRTRATTTATGCSRPSTTWPASRRWPASSTGGTTGSATSQLSARRRRALLSVLAPPRRRRRARPRLHRRRAGDPVPRRPLPGPLRGGTQAVRAAADPGVRGGVHPRPHARPGDRGVRARGAAARSIPPAAPATSCSAPSTGCSTPGRGRSLGCPCATAWPARSPRSTAWT